MHDIVSRRSRSLLAAAVLTSYLGGCQPSNLFQGRLFLINSTGGVLRSPTVLNVRPGLEQKFEFAELADGQAWVLDCRGDRPIVVWGDLKLSYLDKTGVQRDRSVPFRGEIPDYCYDDFFIEIDKHDQMWSGLLAHKNYHESNYAIIGTHALAGAFGLILGWMIWRKVRNWPDQDQSKESFTFEI